MNKVTALLGALALASSPCAADEGNPVDDGDKSAAPEEIQHLPTFVPADGFAPEPRQEHEVLELNDAGCLTLKGDVMAFPQGSEIGNDGAIRTPDGKVLRWWVANTLWIATIQPTRKTVGSITDIGACSDQETPRTIFLDAVAG